MSIALSPAALAQSAGPLSAEHHQQIASAHARGAKIRSAARVAAFNGWVTGAFALLSLPFAPFSVAGFLVAVGLCVVTYNEFRGKRLLLAFDPKAATLLGWNQVGFLGLIIVYSLWMIVEGLTGPGPLSKELEQYPELQQALGSQEEFQRFYQLIIVAIYGTVIALSAVFQGLNALYYFTRSRHILAYLRETPGWIVEMQRATPK
ncbi:MAG: hypothetical protein ACR2FY_04350 [Pirellulaceae bacterium]